MERQRINVYLDNDQIEKLKALTGATRVKMADYIREGIDLVLEKYKMELNKTKNKGGDE